MTWLQRIEAALQTGRFTRDDKLKGDWNVCAVGERLVPKLGLNYSTVRIDQRTWDLAFAFSEAVRDDLPEAAMLLWKEIQEKI